MRVRRPVPNAVGLSVLDLICGFFGLLVVLFAITHRVDGLPGVPSQPLKIVRVETESNDQVYLGLAIAVKGADYHNWPNCDDVGPIRWGGCEPGLIEAVIEGLEPAMELRVLAIKRADGQPLISRSVRVRVSTNATSTTCDLTQGNFYRARVAACQP